MMVIQLKDWHELDEIRDDLDWSWHDDWDVDEDELRIFVRNVESEADMDPALLDSLEIIGADLYRLAD